MLYTALPREWLFRRRADLFYAFLQRGLQVKRHAVLLEQIGKSFIYEFLKGRHPPSPEVDKVHERIVINLDAFARHGRADLRLRLAAGFSGAPWLRVMK